MDDSESWQRNKWWLFDRVVESPHRTSFFVRRALPEAGGTTQEDMQEAAQFWWVHLQDRARPEGSQWYTLQVQRTPNSPARTLSSSYGGGV